MSRIFLSHSSANNAQAVALCAWLKKEGWQDIFLDVDPDRGIVAGERWERALNAAVGRCEAVLFLISRAWLSSSWCLRELNLAHRLNKPLFGVMIEDVSVTDVPQDLSQEWQLINLATGRDHIFLDAVMPITHELVSVNFSAEGLQRLQNGLEKAGLDPKYFAWPPEHDPDRAPYRGLKPLEAEDAGIIFGRDAAVIDALDRMRGLREAAPPRMLVVLGASGSGKSSFLRAGVLPRLKRDDANFFALPIIRPDRAVLWGEAGLLPSLEVACREAGLPISRARIRVAMEGGGATLRALFDAIAQQLTVGRSGEGSAAPKPPLLVLPIDQGEEFFNAEGQEEAHVFLSLLKDLMGTDEPALASIWTIRSESYDHLQICEHLESVRQATLSLPPIPKGSYAEVIKGPALRLAGTKRELKIEERLVACLLADVEEGDAKDALPLLAFTLERLYLEHGGDGDLRHSEYESLGGINGSIEAAVEEALRQADKDARIPRQRQLRLTLLRRGFIPWLAQLDPETGVPRRRVARLSEIPKDSRPLVDLLVEQRLLAIDVDKDTGETTIEPAHEALLRQWSLLQSWLKEDTGLLIVLDGVKRAARDWDKHAKAPAWLAHTSERLKSAEALRARHDLAASLKQVDDIYLSACRDAEDAARRRTARGRMVVGALALTLASAGFGWWKQDEFREMYTWRTLMKPTVLSGAAEVRAASEPGASFSDCANGCPELIVLPAGRFLMGSRAGLGLPREHPQHEVSIAKPFAVSRLEVTFAEWDVCAEFGDCSARVSSAGHERGSLPVFNVSWNDAQQYVRWLSRMTAKRYRLLSEAEWEYAARAGRSTHFSFGDDDAALPLHGWYAENANHMPHPGGEKLANRFGLNDMHGNVAEWVEDCWNEDYASAPGYGSAWKAGNCTRRVYRGGSWLHSARVARSAHRDWSEHDRTYDYVGFRIARELD